MTCNGIHTSNKSSLFVLKQYFCSDIDECAIGTDNCDSRAICTNTVGSFTCACRVGYDGNGIFCSGNTNLKVWTLKATEIMNVLAFTHRYQ